MATTNAKLLSPLIVCLKAFHHIFTFIPLYNPADFNLVIWINCCYRFSRRDVCNKMAKQQRKNVTSFLEEEIKIKPNQMLKNVTKVSPVLYVAFKYT